MKYAVKVNKFHVSDPYNRMAICPSGFFDTGEEIKKFIEEKVEKYKSIPEHYVLFEIVEVQKQ